MGRFLRSCGWDGRIVVRNEAGAVLHTFEPADPANAAKELNLVRTDDYKFRLASSSTFEGNAKWAHLFSTLAAQLGRADLTAVTDLVYSFDYFTRSEKDCPGLGEKVKAILGV